jgi:hypothetical protein
MSEKLYKTPEGEAFTLIGLYKRIEANESKLKYYVDVINSLEKRVNELDNERIIYIKRE